MEWNKKERRKWDYIAVITIRQNITKPIFIRPLDYKVKLKFLPIYLVHMTISA